MTNPTNPTNAYTIPSVSITTARTGASSKANALGMRNMQERAESIEIWGAISTLLVQKPICDWLAG